MKSIIGIAVVLCCLAGGGGAKAAHGLDSQRTGPVPGVYVVKLSATADPAQLRQALSRDEQFAPIVRGELSGQLRGTEELSRFYLYHHQSQALSTADVEAALGRGNVDWVEPDYFLELFDFPSDSLFEFQWHLNNTGQDYLGIDRIPGFYNDTLMIKSGLAGEDIRLAPLYQAPPAEATRVVVAIIDSGVDVTHPELQDNLWANPDEIPGNGIDDDHNGYVDDTLGYDISGDVYDFFDPIGDNDPTDTVGHGSHIAGIVAAAADSYGVIGVAPTARIMPVKIFPNATNAVAARGIFYAVNAGAKAINISWGSPLPSGLVQAALDFARLNGVFVAIASGNSGDNSRFYPAAYDSTFVVGAGNADGFMTFFSTYGAHIDLIAPGRDILSIRGAETDMYAPGERGVRIVDPDSLYYLSDGTSMAAPMAVGAAARIWSYHPELPLSELENILRWGARDLVDPLDQGDSLPGPDTLCGWGYLDIDASYQLITNGGTFVVEPVAQNRTTMDMPIKIAPVAGYDGSWTLDYAVGAASENWQEVASGSTMPTDSLAYTFTDSDPTGIIRLRLTDQFGSSYVTRFTHVRERRVAITEPADGARVKYNIPITGSVYGPDYDSLQILSRNPSGGREFLLTSSGEYFDSLLHVWSISGGDTGTYKLYIIGHFDGATETDSVEVIVESAFAAGWPQGFNGNGGLTPISCDMDRDGFREVALGTTNGLIVYDVTSEGVTPADGFPAGDGANLQCVPAVYDVDRDGFDEIIVTGEDSLYVFNHDGTPTAGWPQSCETDALPFGYGYPNPIVTRLAPGEDSAIVIIGKEGVIQAFRFSGDPYFFSLGGFFASFNSRISSFNLYGGSTSQALAAADLDGDGSREVIATMTSPPPYEGLGVFEARTGRPAYDPYDPVVVRAAQPYGATLADLDRDGLPEVVLIAYDRTFSPTLYVVTKGDQDFPGWPRPLPERYNWIVSPPIVADLDLDGYPEILLSFFEYDISSLYIFNGDGSAYVERPGRPEGEAFFAPGTLATPMVGNLLGDDRPEIVMRSGHLLPGTGSEDLYILNSAAEPVAGWPIATPTPHDAVLSSRYVPLIDDLDGDSLVELALVTDGDEILVWDFPASSDGGKNTGRFLQDNLNSNQLPTLPLPAEQPMALSGPRRPDTTTVVALSGDSLTVRFHLDSPGTVELVSIDSEGDRSVLRRIQGISGANSVSLVSPNTDSLRRVVVRMPGRSISEVVRRRP